MTNPANEGDTKQSSQQFEAWKQYESIAMHFNDLIARFRLQALGGTVTIGTVGVLYTNNKSTEWVFVGMLGFLSVAWTAVWQLDYGYYQRLLSGTVDTLLALELKMTDVKLSTGIEGAFHKRLHGHFWFYVLIQGALLGALAIATHGPWVHDCFGCFRVVPIGLGAWLCGVICVSWPRKAPRRGT